MAKFLVVDDEADVLFLLEANLRAFGHEVVTTGELDEARRLLAVGDVDALVIDVTMPEMEGPDFVREVRAAGTEPATVFLLSAVPPEQLKVLAADLGVHGVAKPFTSETLRESLAPAMC